MKTPEAIRKVLTDSGFTPDGDRYVKKEDIDGQTCITTFDTAAGTLYREIADWESKWEQILTATRLQRTLDGLKYYKVTLKP